MKFSTLSLAAFAVQGASAATLRGERKTQVLYYPRYTGDFLTGWCTSNNNFAQGSPGYATELECCNAAFAGQSTGKCYSMLPAPPTVSPTGADGPDAWYADYNIDFADGVCKNKMPAPVGRAIYDTQLECCKAEYGTQTTGACLADLPSPPTVSPTAEGGPDAWYPNTDLDWADGVCTNKMPAPLGRTIYDSQLECCKGFYGTQSSGACLADLPSPPTVSPTAEGGVDIYYKAPNVDYALGYCTNKLPTPNGVVTYDTELECCKGEYASQSSGVCLSMLPAPPTVSPTGADGPDAWYADFDLGWTNGVCKNKMPAPLGRTIYETQLECCKGAYPGQESGACLADLPSPPTVSPTAEGGPDAWYANRNIDFVDGVCTNKMPAPVGAVIYDSQLECCKAEYGTQTSGACLADLPSPPTVSPTAEGGPDAWYPNTDLDWADGVCTNKMPAPLGRTIYDSQLECCKGFYGTQSSGACLADLPSPPTVSPTAEGGVDIWYKAPNVDWTVGYCTNKLPTPNGVVTYDSELECCKGAYAGQSSGACLASLPSPPTVSPTGADGPDAWYSNYASWEVGKCINTAPVPVGRDVYATQLECCKGYYGSQTSGACLNDLPSPPTSSPIDASTAKFFPIWDGWQTGHCDNDPTKATSGNNYQYDTQEECCDAWFKNQESNACMNFDPTYGSKSPTQAPVL